MRSPPCWKTLCLQRSKFSRRTIAAKQKLNGEQAPAKLAVCLEEELAVLRWQHARRALC